MERNVKDSQELSIVAMLTKGTPKTSKVEFVFLRAEDSTELKKVAGELVADPQYSTAKTATCKFKPDPVPDDKEQYGVKYKVICDREEFAQGEIIKVWPAKGKLEAKNADDKKVLANFQFKVVQPGKPENPVCITDDKGVAEFKLQEGAPFTIEPVVPFEVKKKEAKKLRDVAVEAVRQFTPVFCEPLRPDDGKIKQYVNIVSAKHGKDGLGPTVKIKIQVHEDVLHPSKPKIGGPGVFAHIKVKFGGSGTLKKSERSTPATELLAAGVTDLVAVTPHVEYTGKVELKTAGTGEFEISLGSAGGDTCEVSLGSAKDTYTAHTLTFTNWRKVYYELMAPKILGDRLAEKTLADGTKIKDFAGGAKTAMVDSGASTFVDYDCVNSKIYDVDASVRAAGMVMAREFFGLSSGPAEVTVLTDHTFTLNPGGAFAKAKTPVSGFKLCDFNLFAESDSAEPPITRDGEGTTQSIPVRLGPNTYWLPKSSLDGSDTIRSIKWVAKIAGIAKTKPVVAWVDAVDAAKDTATKKVVTVTETALHKSIDLSFDKGSEAAVPTVLSSAERTRLRHFLTDELLSADHRRKVVDQFKVSLSSAASDARHAAVKQAVQEVADNCAELMTHPAVKPDGTAQSGTLAPGDYDLAASTFGQVMVKLPDASEPAKLVGALSATRCPIIAKVELKGHHQGLGLAGQGQEKGTLLSVFSTANPISATHITLHELGHQYNLTTYNQADNAHAPGIKKRSSTGEAEAIAAYKNNGDKGHYYTGKGHSGSHCAYGLSDVDKAGATYDPGGARAKCIMFGSSTIKDAGYSRSFCPQCSELIRARDLSALK